MDLKEGPVLKKKKKRQDTQVQIALKFGVNAKDILAKIKKIVMQRKKEKLVQLFGGVVLVLIPRQNILIRKEHTWLRGK